MKTTQYLRPVWLLIATILGISLIAGCGSATADAQVDPLASVTELSGKGIITEAQLNTIKAKSGTYDFTGSSNGFEYTWTFDAAQVQNPTDQHLKLDITTKGLNDIKQAASGAQYALSVKVADFELAGSPRLTITVPEKWTAKSTYLAAMQEGHLRKFAEANPALTARDENTELSATITVTNKTLYFVAGGDSSTGAAEDTETSSANVSGTPGSSADSDVSRETSQESSKNSNKAESQGSKNATQQKTPASDGSFSVKLSIDAQTLVGHLNEVKQEKRAFVPANGWILQPTTVRLTEGQNVYDALVAATKAHGIQMESRWTPLYGSYYVNGINQLYERDAGGLSGWMYSVDGWYSNYGASSYAALHDGSVIKWRYTRDLGADLGASAR